MKAIRGLAAAMMLLMAGSAHAAEAPASFEPAALPEAFAPREDALDEHPGIVSSNIPYTIYGAVIVAGAIASIVVVATIDADERATSNTQTGLIYGFAIVSALSGTAMIVVGNRPKGKRDKALSVGLGGVRFRGDF